MTDEDEKRRLRAFSDPHSLAAEAEHARQAKEIRADIAENGDFMVDLGDGKGERDVSAILDELDKEAEFVAFLEQIAGDKPQSH